MRPRATPWLLALVVLALLAAAPLYASAFTITLLNYIGIYALVALGLVLLTGFGGLTSFGQAAFVGIAAYATAWLTTVEGASPWLGLILPDVRTRRMSGRRRWTSRASAKPSMSPGMLMSLNTSVTSAHRN